MTNAMVYNKQTENRSIAGAVSLGKTGSS